MSMNFNSQHAVFFSEISYAALYLTLLCLTLWYNNNIMLLSPKNLQKYAILKTKIKLAYYNSANHVAILNRHKANCFAFMPVSHFFSTFRINTF